MSRRSYPDVDWKEILTLCRTHYGSGIKKSSHPKSSSSFSEFKRWLESGIGDGDIVSVNGMTGIFCDNGDGTYKLLARYLINNKIIVEDVKINSNDCSVVDDTDFYKDLRKQGYQYFLSLGIVEERNLPRNFQTVSFSYKGQYGVGIIRKSRVNTTEFVCAFLDSLKTDATYDTYDLDFFPASKEDVRILVNQLNSEQLKFDKKTSQLVWARKRAVKGEKYWYITDTFSLKMVSDKGTTVDNVRYEVGNYFLLYDDCLKFRDEMVGKRKGRQ